MKAKIFRNCNRTTAGACLAFIFCFAMACPPRAAAQVLELNPFRGTEAGVWQARSIANGHVFGFAQERTLALTGLRFAVPVKHFLGFTLKYKIDAIPIAFLRDLEPNGRRLWVKGAGAAPVGAEMTMPRLWKLQPFAETGAGFLFFQQRVLAAQGSQFNFTVELGGGVQARTTRHTAVSFGYRYHHLSNANISHRNPGVDSQLLTVGFNLLL